MYDLSFWFVVGVLMGWCLICLFTLFYYDGFAFVLDALGFMSLIVACCLGLCWRLVCWDV